MRYIRKSSYKLISLMRFVLSFVYAFTCLFLIDSNNFVSHANTLSNPATSFHMLSAIYNAATLPDNSDTDAVLSGNCGAEGDGSNVKWTFDNGTLTISGSGKMIDKNEVDNRMISEEILAPSLVKKVIIDDGVTNIGDYAFFWYDKITELTMADSVTSIGAFSLAACGSLSTVKLSDNLTTIKNNAFVSCSSIIDITLPDSLSYIGEAAFNQCTGIRELTIPKNVSFIDYWAFSNCTALKKIDINCPALGSCVFMGCTSLTTVNFNPKFERVDGQCFSGCTDLKTITLPDSLTFIGCYAFEGCSRLESINIPDSVTQIDDGAFLMCSSLSKIHLPEGLTTISPKLLSGCVALSDITIPSSVTSIENNAFDSCKIADITLPDSVSSIGDEAFFGCNLLQKVELPSTLKTIGNKAFDSCFSLAQINFPDSLISIGDNSFASCEKLDTVILPNHLTTLGRNAFMAERIVLPDTLTNIRNYAFGDTDNTDSRISIIYCATKSQIEYCKEFDYTYIDAREKIDINNSTIKTTSTSYIHTGNAITPECAITYSQDNQLIPLKENFDYTLEYIDNINVGTATVKITGIGLFENSTVVNFEIINPSPSNPATDSGSNNTDNKNSSSGNSTTNSGNFQRSDNGSNGISNTINPNNNQESYILVKSAYYKITGKNTVTYIKPKSTKNKSVKIKSTVKIKGKKYKITAIASYACKNCKSLKTVYLGNNIKTIGDSAFENCSKLSSVTFGKNIRKIGKRVLYNDKKIKKIKFTGKKVKSIGKKTFYKVPRTANILVPNSKVPAYVKMINNASK